MMIHDDNFSATSLFKTLLFSLSIFLFHGENTTDNIVFDWNKPCSISQVEVTAVLCAAERESGFRLCQFVQSTSKIPGGGP